MKSTALFAIRFYQRVISPYKGFRCAYAAYTGRASCSALGYRAIRRFGVWHGMALLNGRLEKCGLAHRRHRPAAAPLIGRLGKQGGFLDCGGCDAPTGCDVPTGCDMPTGCAVPSSCELPSGAADACGTALDCSTCDCGWPWRRRNKRDDLAVVVLPPTNVTRQP